jgi:hypothetical protein
MKRDRNINAFKAWFSKFVEFSESVSKARSLNQWERSSFASYAAQVDDLRNWI